MKRVIDDDREGTTFADQPAMATETLPDATSRDLAASPDRERHSRIPSGVVSVLACLLVLVSLVYLFRNPIATSLANAAIARQPKVQCSRADVRVARALDGATLSNVDCAVLSGPVAQAEFAGDSVIDLDGLSVRRVRLGKGTIDQRDRDVSGAHGDLPINLGKLVGLTDSVMKGMLDASEMYSADAPLITASELLVKRAGKSEAVLHDFSKRQVGEWNRLHAMRVEMGTDLVAVRNFEMRVTPKRGVVTADVFLGQPKPGAAPDIQLRVKGERLDTKSPRFALD